VHVIVPDPDMVKVIAGKKGIEIKPDFAAWIQTEEAQTFFLEEIKTVAKNFKLNGFEIPHKVHLTTTIFTPMNVLTPSMKMIRTEAKNFFLKEIKQMYGGAKLQGEE